MLTAQANGRVYQADLVAPQEYTPLRATVRQIPVAEYYTADSSFITVATVAARWSQLPKRATATQRPHPDSVYWYRLLLVGGPSFTGTQLLNVGPGPLDELYAFDLIQTYRRGTTGAWIEQHAGRSIPRGERSVESWINLLTMEGRAGDTTELFVRLSGANPVFQPGAVNFWHVDPLPLLTEQAERAFRDGIFYGLVGLQVIFFLLLFIIERQRIYGWFAVLCLGIFTFTAWSIILDEYHAPFPWWDRAHLFLAAIGFSIAHTGVLCFTMTYFKIPFSRRPWNWIIPAVLLLSWPANFWTGLFKTTANWFTPLYRSLEVLDNALGIGVCLLSVGMVFSAPRQPGVSKAFYLLALSPIIFMAAYWLGQDLIIGLRGQELVHPENLDTMVWFKWSALTMLMLLSLGIGQRNNALRKEKLRVQQRLLSNLQQTDQLQEIDRLKTRFYTNITHEFRTPLTVILGLARRLDTPGSAYLIQRNGRKLLQLVNRLLELSKLTSGAVTPAYRRVDIVAYTRYLAESYQSMAVDRGINLTIYSEERALELDTDPERYRQIVSNLLTNALKFTPHGGEVILHLAQTEASQLQLKVTDTGTGIAAAALTHVFDRFYQTDNASSQEGEGTGVGLALVKETVDLLDGQITVSSELGTGSVFTVQLPITRQALAAMTSFEGMEPEELTIPASTTVPEEIAAAGPLRKLPELLLVEDNADVVTYLLSVLRTHYTVAVARDGQSGIDRATATVPDLIVSDVAMPVRDGFAVVEAVKSDERTSHIPIVLLTARAGQQDRVAGLRYGADAYLTKPFHEEELLVQLRNLIDSRRRLQQHYRQFRGTPADEQAAATESLTPDERFLHRLEELLEANYTESDFGVADYAVAMQMSHTQLYRKLKALVSRTPSRHINAYRLTMGKRMLTEQEELHVSEVAYAVGFRDPNYFTRLFTEAYGQSPNAYRASIMY